MNDTELIAAIDTEITRLTQVRDLLGAGADGSSAGATNRTASRSIGSSEPTRRGRPKGSKNKATSFNPEEFAPKRRTLTAAGKKRIAAAQRARGAKQKGKAAVTKSRPTTAKTAATKSSRQRPGTKKTSALAKKPAAKSLTTSAGPANAVLAKKAANKSTSAKKTTAKPAAKTPAKQPVARKQAEANVYASPPPALTTSVAEGAASTAAE